jgi:hypothetical protein
MSGFSPEWLALREPVDHRSISALVRRELIEAVAARPRLAIVDLGAGAGSNLRGLAPWLAMPQEWRLVDYDPTLIEAARRRLAGFRCRAPLAISYQQADLATGDMGAILAGADVVTAAALFDLASRAMIERLAEAVAARRQIFVTVLTYDGIAAWLPPHPADEAMRLAFNDHQRRDKGLGPAEGPGATATLANAFAARGYRIVRARSPWVVDGEFAALRHSLDAGIAGAVRETGLVAAPTVDDWLANRERAADAVSIIGHEDMLALPPGA